MLILLPPSEGKTAPRRGRPLDLGALSFPSLSDARAQVLDALVTLCSDDVDKAASVLGLPPTAAPELVARNAGLRGAPAGRADRVYTGVLYDALGFGTLSAAAKRRATGRVAITSALFGLLRPGDRIPAYRLSGDAVLPGIGSIAPFWRAAPDVVGDGLVVDLRSSMYAGFWRPGAGDGRRVVTVRVLHEVDGQRKVVSHFNKATKGRIVRALLESGANPRTPKGLVAALSDLGWAVEVGAPMTTGTPLDVIVPTL